MKIIKKNKYILIAIIVLIAFIYVFQFPKQDDISENSQKGKYELVNALEFDDLAEKDNAFVLDVHTPEQTHIPGTDAFIPYNKIKENIDSLPKDKSVPILVYCRSGSMSKKASDDLIELGYTEVYDLSGGINAYKESHVKVEINPSSTDLGTVIYGDVPTTNFTLTNFSPAPLTITKVTTSCTCTSAEVLKKNLDPYETTEIKVSFNPAVHKDDSDLGELTRTIYIDTDNPNFKQVTAEITANVIKK